MQNHNAPVLMVPEHFFSRNAYCWHETSHDSYYGALAWLLHRLDIAEERYYSIGFTNRNRLITEFYNLDNIDIKVIFFASLNYNYVRIFDYLSLHAIDPLKEENVWKI